MRIYFTFLIMMFLCGCTGMNEKMQSHLQGKWEQKLRPDMIYMAGERNDFIFHNDSFKVRMTWWSDEIFYNPWDPCWFVEPVEYAAGKYLMDNNNIYLNGTYTDSNYKFIKASCFHQGKFTKIYEYEIFKDSAYLNIPDSKNIYSTEIILKKVND